ncbi:hypothetical protein KI387_016445, partial [Taxus chinensis]
YEDKLKSIELDLKDTTSDLKMYGRFEKISKALDDFLEGQRGSDDKTGLRFQGNKYHEVGPSSKSNVKMTKRTSLRKYNSVRQHNAM